MKKKAIVFASVYYRSNIKVGSQHYADELVNLGYEVYYISYPVSIFHYFAYFTNSSESKNRLKSLKVKNENLTSVVPFSLFPLINLFPFNSPFFLLSWIYFSDIFYSKNFIKFASESELIWCESAFFVTLINKILSIKSDIKLIFRLSDNVLAFGNFPKYYKVLLNLMYEISNKIVVSALTLKNVIDQKYHEKIVHLPNGINIQRLKNYSTNIPVEYKYDNNFKLVYVGAIESWFNWDILKLLLDKLPNISIYLIGPSDKINKDFIFKYKNLKVLGPKNHKLIGEYIANANIGIIPFIRNDLINYVDPIKFYEYSYFGIPTVCTYWDEVSSLDNYLYLAKTDQEFLDFIINQFQQNHLFRAKERFNLTYRQWDYNLKYILSCI
jgi:hypothetical protein